MECPNCGAQVVGTVCEYCGTILKGAEPQVVIVNNYYGPEAKQGQTGSSQWGGQQSSAGPQSTAYTPQSSTNSQFSGGSQTVDYGNASPKSRMVTVLLAFFFGCLGVHRFYIGSYGMGILYLFTCGLFCFGWAIDLILAIMGNLKDAQGRPITRW